MKKVRVRVTKKERKKMRELQSRTSTKTVKLKCSKMTNPICKEQKGIWLINTSYPELYTKEVRATYVCPLCKPIKKRGAK